MEKRDGFLTLTRKRIEAAVESNGYPGIMVAHSVWFIMSSIHITPGLVLFSLQYLSFIYLP
jgi:hypothetical protein